MHVTENRLLVNLPAGQLYVHQSAKINAENKDPEAVKALFSAYIEKQKASQPKFNAASIPAFIDEVEDAFAELYVNEGEEETALSKFFNSLVAELKESQDPAAKLATERLLGQFLFLLDTDQKQVEELVAGENPKHKIATSFTEALKREASAFDADISERKKGKIVNDLYRNLLPSILAGLVITSTGMLNTAIFDDVQKAFFANGNLPNQKEIADVLANLAKREELYALLNKVKAPTEEQAISDILELANNEEVTDAHAKECVLAACLTQIVPQAGDDQVITTFGQLLKQANPHRFMDLIHKLLKKSELEFKIEGQSELVSFALDGSSRSLVKTLSAGVDGAITNRWSMPYIDRNDYLWQIQGIIKACKAMDIENIPEACLAALKILGGNNPANRFDITAKAVISEMAKAEIRKLKDADPDLERTAEELAISGHIAFTATYENVLVAVLQNALQKMAAIRSQSEYLARVYHAVRDVLFDKFTSKDIHERAGLGRIFTSFLAKLQSSLTNERPANEKAFRELVIKTLPEADLEHPQVKNIVAFIKSDAFKQPVASLAVDPTGFVRTFVGAKTESFEPKDAKALFDKLIQQPKGFLVSPQQAFVFTPEHKALSKSQRREFWEQCKDQATANLKMMINENRSAIYTWVQENLLHPDVKGLFAEGVADKQTTIKPNLDFNAFRKELLIRINGYIKGEGFELAKRELDDFFVTALHKAKKMQVIPIATATREIDGVLAQLCFYPDPISNQFAIGMLRGDNLVRLNQKEWFSGTWELGQEEAAEQVLV